MIGGNPFLGGGQPGGDPYGGGFSYNMGSDVGSDDLFPAGSPTISIPASQRSNFSPTNPFAHPEFGLKSKGLRSPDVMVDVDWIRENFQVNIQDIRSDRCRHDHSSGLS